MAVTSRSVAVVSALLLPLPSLLAGLSLSSFERQIRRVYGLTPSQLLTRARLDAATRLLRETDLPIARVAAECGYFDHSAFARVFRSVVGLTPVQFRGLQFREMQFREVQFREVQGRDQARG